METPTNHAACECNESSQEDTESPKKKEQSNEHLDAWRELTYTVYGTSVENTVRLLSCNKGISLFDKHDAAGRAKRFFINSSASIREHRAFFGQTRALIMHNLKDAGPVEWRVRK